MSQEQLLLVRLRLGYILNYCSDLTEARMEAKELLRALNGDAYCEKCQSAPPADGYCLATGCPGRADK